MSSPLLKSENNYELKRKLGSGAYGVVNRIVTIIDDPMLNKKAPQEYALKQIDIGKFKIDERQVALECAKEEYALLKKKLDNVVPAFGSYYDSKYNNFIFTMELFPQNLKTLIENSPRKFTFDEYWPLFQDIIRGILTISFLKLR
jgi:serine/threonine protein kinase